MAADARIAAITARIVERSKPAREAYLGRLKDAASRGAHRGVLSCGNLAHGFAVCFPRREGNARGRPARPISASSPPTMTCCRPTSRTRPIPPSSARAAREAGGVAQVAGGVPAMCDGVTQGQPGMELSLFSRDVIAMAAGIGLSHNMFDAAVYLASATRSCQACNRRPDIRAPAGSLYSRRPDDHRPAQRREVPRPPALCRRQGRARRVAGSRVEVLSRSGHLHLLRHRQFQPDADGDHGLPHARLVLHQSRHAVARCTDPGSDAAGTGDHRAGQRIHPRRRDDRRAVDRQWCHRPAHDRRFDEPHAASGGDRTRRRHSPDLAGYFPTFRM